MSPTTTPQAPISRILVIDDNEANRKLLEGHLVSAGYAVELAVDGATGVDRFRQRPPDLVLLDVVMPGIDGFETCRRIRDLPSGRDIPVVFVTALSDLGSHQRALESGADDFLTKPVNRTELLMRVRSLLWVRRLRQELVDGYDLIRSQHTALIRSQNEKEQFMAMLVHDLKNPLAAVLGNIDFLMRDAELSDDSREALGDAQMSAETMHRMILDLLDLSCNDEGHLRLSPVELDPRALATAAVTMMRRRADTRRMRLELTCRGEGTMFADPDVVRRIVDNLIDNALKYAPEGTVVHVEVAIEPETVVISVRDEGVGVPAEQRERIFEPYVRLDVPGALASTSRGIGLAFCRLAAEAHGGTVHVEENRPRGALFVAELSRLAPAAPE